MMKAWRLGPWIAVFATGLAGVGAYLAYRGTVAPVPAKSVGNPAAANFERRALLIGCGDYVNPDIRPLEGPANDVQLLKQVLVERCGFSPEAITTLAGDAKSSDAPTRANIEREFNRLRTVARKDDQIVILLAGHGSQQPNQPDDVDDAEPDGLDEIFLPIDTGQWSRAEGGAVSGGVVNAIIDDEIYRWTAAIADQGATVWAIFDCCCAGTAIRGDYQEIPRFVSAAGDLRVPATAVPKTKRPRDTAGSKSDEASWEASPTDRIVAFYACQANESELELALPPASDANVERAKHGLLTYALCGSLSEPSGARLTYRDLAHEIWLRYRAWGRAAPTPFVDGAIDRQVLGERRRNTRFRVIRRSGRDCVIDAGGLQGLTPGSIVALFPSGAGGAALEERPAGYARVTHVQATTSRIVPCAYGEVRRAVGVEVGAWCELVYADFGDMRLSVAIDHHSGLRAGQTASELAQLTEQLRLLADLPTSVFHVADASAADWIIQARGTGVELLPRFAAELEESEELPLGTPHFAIDEATSADAVAELLQRVFRARNLIKLAAGFHSGADRGRGPLRVNLELLSQSGSPLADATVLVPGEKVEWKITNEGTTAVDLTLLFIDSQLAIAPAYPQPGDLSGNRLEPGKSCSITGTVSGNTVGTEHLVAIAARARGPQRNFCCLAEPALDAAQKLVPKLRGGEEGVFESPLGLLMRYALYNDRSFAGTTRGLTSVDADDCYLTLRAWVVNPN